MGGTVTPDTDPYARLAAEGDSDFFAGIARTENPHPPGHPLFALWHDKWDAAAQSAAKLLSDTEYGRLLRAAGMVRAAIAEAATVLRDMRLRPRSIPAWSARPRDAEAKLLAALAAFPQSATEVSPCRAS